LNAGAALTPIACSHNEHLVTPKRARSSDIPDDDDSAAPADKEFMATLAKGLAVIRAFGAERPRMTLSRAAAEVGLSRAAARRILLTLLELGYVEREGREFALTPAVMELGFSYLAAQSWIDRLTPMLRALGEELGETCSAAVLRGQDIVCVARVETSRLLTSAIAIGSRLPAWHTAMGRMLLGTLSDDELWRRLRAARVDPFTPGSITDLEALFARVREDRERGFSIVDEELERGLRSIAVLLTTRRGRAIGAIDVGVHSQRFTRVELRERFLPRLIDVAGRVRQATD
jgi:IclR family pca regulon transcriptional regulator